MQKLTIFSVLLSISVVLIVVDTVSHNYLAAPEAPESLETPVENADAPLLEEPAEEAAVSLSEDLSSSLNASLFESANFTSPVLKDTLYSGLVFQFISFSDQNEATIYQWNLFDGEQYVGSIYEIKYPTETGSFQGYLALRERAMNLSEIGLVNEVNNYGDASFYFNHKNKIKTVHLVLRTGSSVYAFDYSQSNHEKMKKVFDSLVPVL